MATYFSGKRVLVTGGAGFLGSVVCRKLAERKASEIIVPRSRGYDLTREDEAEKLFADAAPDLVLHLAARVGGIGANRLNPAVLYRTNLLMGTHVIDGALRRDVAKTVVAGTICSYPKHAPVPFREESFWDGFPEETNAPYGIAKKALIVHGAANRAQYGQCVINPLPTNLYGPGDKFNPEVSHVVPALIKKCVDAVDGRNEVVDVWGTGTATREFLFVEDCAEGILLAAEHYDEPDPVNLGSGREVPIKDLARMIAGICGFGGELRWDSSRPDGQPRRCLDTTKADESFGFRATTLLESGIAATVDWYRAHRVEAEAKAF